MIIITGGRFQGKRDFAFRLAAEKKKYPDAEKGTSGNLPDDPEGKKIRTAAISEKKVRVVEGQTAEKEQIGCADIFLNLEEWILRRMKEGEDPGMISGFLQAANPDMIVVLQEMGCGIVPIDPQERAWRENCGRVGCNLAEQAEEVYRLTCGIAQRIK